MCIKTIEKRRKRSWPLYLTKRKRRYTAWIASDEALFHLSFTIGKTKIKNTSSKKRPKEVKCKLAIGCYGMDGNDCNVRFSPEGDTFVTKRCGSE
ncbi:hypothetical protein TNCV_3968581 [Trichonephila clavipes]|nr:hypothetical protein TNCV_3968581 [Trichonephila clavipes]